jgi:hypothetical protein
MRDEEEVTFNAQRCGLAGRTFSAFSVACCVTLCVLAERCNGHNLIPTGKILIKMKVPSRRPH